MTTELFKLARTKAERRKVIAELAHNFERWNKMTDQELMDEAKKTFAALSGQPNRGFLLKYLTMNHLDQID